MAAPTLALYAHSTQCTLILLLKANSKTTENEPFRWKIYGSFNCNIMHTGINSCCVNRPNRQIYDLCPRSFSLSPSFSLLLRLGTTQCYTKSSIHTREKNDTYALTHKPSVAQSTNGVLPFFRCKNHLFSNREVNNNRTKKKNATTHQGYNKLLKYDCRY